MIAGIFLVQKISHKRWQIYRKKSSNLNAYVHEDIAGMNVVQSFGAEDETKEIFENLTDEHRNAFVDAVILQICSDRSLTSAGNRSDDAISGRIRFLG